jgi:hypothetical protein
MKNVLSVRLNEVRQFTRLLRMSKKNGRKKGQKVGGGQEREKEKWAQRSVIFFFLFLKKKRWTTLFIGRDGLVATDYYIIIRVATIGVNGVLMSDHLPLSFSALPVPYNIHLLFIFLKRPYNKRMSLLRDEQHVNDVTSGRDGRDIPKEKKIKDEGPGVNRTLFFFFLIFLANNTTTVDKMYSFLSRFLMYTGRIIDHPSPSACVYFWNFILHPPFFF